MPSTAEAASRSAPRGARRAALAYWISTGLVCAVMVFSVLSFTFYDHFPFPNGKEGAFVHLGLPPYFKVELTIAKALGVLALLVPGVPRKIREFAYFGFGLTLLSAAIAHFSVGDARLLSPLYVIDPLLFLGCLTVSYAGFLRGAPEAFRGPPAQPGVGSNGAATVRSVRVARPAPPSEAAPR
ncbi:DoxX family protein [Anaeromyxobacter sp. PSR-1]|uniref:DoxX family protein n=1 Tax=Anaeromyxobacter sp. PSR-1 TaxID=1300915 RepID=UPI0009E1B986|nr:DoxX family protein [Anaeromyxobacter sp. PSR-1]